MARLDTRTAKDEDRFHQYVGNNIPWYIHLLWLLFWSFAVYYTLTWLLPALQVEMVSPP